MVIETDKLKKVLKDCEVVKIEYEQKLKESHIEYKKICEQIEVLNGKIFR